MRSFSSRFSRQPDQEQSYSQEFDQRLKKLLVEQRWENLKSLEFGKLQAVVLFGSLSNRDPKMRQDGEQLESDADILLFYDTRSDKPLNRSKKYSDNRHYEDAERFSKRISEADVFIWNMATVRLLHDKSLTALASEYEKLLKHLNEPQDPYSLPVSRERKIEVAMSEVQRKYSVLPQLLLGGEVLQGEIPSEARDLAQEVYNVYHEVLKKMHDLRAQPPRA